jgi:NADH:ubiquinone oxidoreductase subunit 6 (subunit J)
MNVTAATSMFYFFEALAAISALALLFTRHVFYGAILVIVCLLSLAGIYVLAFAEFVAVVQILIYAGGILIVILFGIMLTSRTSGKPLVVQNGNQITGAIIGIVIFASLLYYFDDIHSDEKGYYFIASELWNQSDHVRQVGVNILVPYLLPFEVAGILLLIALVGAAVTASSTKQDKHVSN